MICHVNPRASTDPVPLRPKSSNIAASCKQDQHDRLGKLQLDSPVVKPGCPVKGQHKVIEEIIGIRLPSLSWSDMYGFINQKVENNYQVSAQLL